MKSPTLYVLTVLVLTSCLSSRKIHRDTYKEFNEVIHSEEFLDKNKFLKAHFESGEVCIYTSTWVIDEEKNEISGEGTLYNHNRKVIETGQIVKSLDEAVLFETNKKLTKDEELIMSRTILIGVDVTMGVVCIIDPKICYGSCPTFYIDEDESVHFSDAEGFSSAILPVQEYLDVDALSHTVNGGDDFTITMKNEALETHCVNKADLYLVPKKRDKQVFNTPSNKFYSCGEAYPLKSAVGINGDLTSELEFEDFNEAFSPSDPENMKSTEDVFLTFDVPVAQEDLGLVLNFRQSLMSTFIFYNGMSYMGDEVSDFFAKAEVEGRMEKSIMSELGGIEVFVWNEEESEWMAQEGFNETGPIAYNKQLVTFQNHSKSGEVKIKLRMNKGLWKLEYSSLVSVEEEISPIVLSPSKVVNEGEVDTESLALLNNDEHLISMPGSDFKLTYEIPELHEEYEMFLGAQGYYLEWMRRNWLSDKDIAKVFQMKYRPSKFLKQSASEFKSYENYSEDAFWNSKIDTKQVSYYGK